MSSLTRKISDLVYHEIEITGFLRGIRWKVYKYIFHHGPVTISQALRDIPHKRDSSVNARFSELRRMGAIIEAGTTIDPLGDQEVTLWDVTDKMPVRLDNKPRTFWMVKREGLIGKGYSRKSQAERIFSKKYSIYPDCELIEVRERIRSKKALVVYPE